MNENRCVVCGAIIPEGRQVCPICEYEEIPRKRNEAKDDEKSRGNSQGEK